ncbi:molybdenum cofactor cytidylyltransferase/nicotine blue oxidoreductase [Mumia flava]|uniref:Molybdenum cofactor cytidylyltransferase/nicotine blue oxidoreductase n=1 Tax=Mumia flava TaxID=1348852 RepID=A0A0B2BUA9_9ACTN|nr:nucleotidyltransferase family protein [Mumia flava]PJJ57004.1 molybdenum cofactor cytidylyltransferase/nicotine blue oxidoreductase [Mumia flava]
MTRQVRAVGVLLAAGAGRRMGRPKALVRAADGTPWVRRGVDVLRGGGCEEVVVVLGASADAVRPLLADADVRIVEAADWSVGMGASLRTGLRALDDGTTGADACLVSLVDLPDVGPDVVARLLTTAAPDALARATYAGRPGHPVLVGRSHWPAMAASLSGDEGARRYLADHGAAAVECGDLATGQDVDRLDDVGT